MGTLSIVGNSQINSIPAWSKVFLHNFSLQNTRKSLRLSASRYFKQLLDEVEHDIMNYQNRGLGYLPKRNAEADNTDTRFWWFMISCKNRIQ